MKLLDKIKNAIFEEEEEFDEEFVNDKPFTKEISNEKKEEKEIVKKIDVDKTLSKSEAVTVEEKPKVKKELRRTTPIIFEEEDFEYEKPKIKAKPKVEIQKEDVKKPLYGGYKEDKTKDKFKPSPVISPVYGFVGISPVLEHKRTDNETHEKHIFTPEEPEKISLDEVRLKAYGTSKEQASEETLEDGLIYDMQENDTPAISKVTLGDAEEYFEDLGLEYNIDYKDDAKDKDKTVKSKTTRSTKNKKLSETVDHEMEIEKEKKLESTQELEITKEQILPKTAEEIKKVKKIEDGNITDSKKEESEEPEEKNLYDLIDMMYDSK